MAFTGVSPAASVFGTPDSEGVVAVQCLQKDAPGGYVFTTIDGNGARLHVFLWADTNGDLRVISADASPVVYDESSQQITFTAFDQDVSGTIVGLQV